MTRIASPRSGRAARPTARTDGQPGVLEVAQHRVLALGDLVGQLLERVDDPVHDEEPDEMARRADRQLAEAVAGVAPRAQRLLPGEVEQVGDLVPEHEAGKRHR